MLCNWSICLSAVCDVINQSIYQLYVTWSRYLSEKILLNCWYTELSHWIITSDNWLDDIIMFVQSVVLLLCSIQTCKITHEISWVLLMNELSLLFWNRLNSWVQLNSWVEPVGSFLPVSWTHDHSIHYIEEDCNRDIINQQSHQMLQSSISLTS